MLLRRSFLALLLSSAPALARLSPRKAIRFSRRTFRPRSSPRAARRSTRPSAPTRSPSCRVLPVRRATRGSGRRTSSITSAASRRRTRTSCWTARRRRLRSSFPHRNEKRESGEGRMLSVEDADEVKKLSGVDEVIATDLLAEHIEGKYLRGGKRVLFTPLAPAEGGSMSRDLAMRYVADAGTDPFDQGVSREGRFAELVRAALPGLRDQGPLAHARRAAADQEPARARDDPQVDEARRARPGGGHALGQARPVRARARRGRQVRLLPQRSPGRRVLLAHRQRPERLLAALQRRQAPDARRRLPAHGLRAGLRLLRERRHPHVPGQREVLPVAARALRLLPRVLPRDPQGPRSRQDGAQVISQAGAAMDPILAAAKFSKPSHRKAAEDFVEKYKKSAESEYPYVGHWVGMATHDVGSHEGPLKPGMVFTIEPALTVPDEKIYVRLEDMIFITRDRRRGRLERRPVGHRQDREADDRRRHAGEVPEGFRADAQPASPDPGSIQDDGKRVAAVTRLP